MVPSLAAIGSIAWVALVVTTPLLPAWAGAVLYGVGSLVCHQIPERSFYVAGFQLPVCARCLGIYIGLAAGTALAWTHAARTIRIRSASLRVVAVVAALPTIATVVLELAGWWATLNLTRAMSGVPLGALAGAVVAIALAPRSPRGTPPPHPAAVQGGGRAPARFDSR